MTLRYPPVGTCYCHACSCARPVCEECGRTACDVCGEIEGDCTCGDDPTYLPSSGAYDPTTPDPWEQS